MGYNARNDEIHNNLVRMRREWEALTTVHRFNARCSAKGYVWFWPKRDRGAQHIAYQTIPALIARTTMPPMVRQLYRSRWSIIAASWDIVANRIPYAAESHARFCLLKIESPLLPVSPVQPKDPFRFLLLRFDHHRKTLVP
jgi:hypothetical protein